MGYVTKHTFICEKRNLSRIETYNIKHYSCTFKSEIVSLKIHKVLLHAQQFTIRLSEFRNANKCY